MSLAQLIACMQPLIEDELKSMVMQTFRDGPEELKYMLAYHMGWEGEGAGPAAQGKRIRPLLVLLSAGAAGGEWQRALPAAAAVELVHNFSLIHDDIQDQSDRRRGRLTVWKLWGVAQAINAGDAMFSLAHLSILRLEQTASPLIALKSARLLQETCLELTKGQYLDMRYESENNLTLEDYWPMVSGKTAALISACCELGALIAEADEIEMKAYRQFGNRLGLAFQAQDDLLGIWGDAALTGKSAESDLLTGKKTLPILYGLSQKGAFAQRWAQGPIKPEEIRQLASQLEREGGLRYTQQITENLTKEALSSLRQAKPAPEYGEALEQLAIQLLNRHG